MQAKPVQIAIIVIGLIVGVVGITLAISKNGTPETANSIMLVDVRTGQLYKVSTSGKTVLVPAKHPETGERSLIRVGFDETQDGYYISPRHMSLLQDLKGEMIGIDRSTGRIDIPSDSVSKPLPN